MIAPSILKNAVRWFYIIDPRWCRPVGELLFVVHEDSDSIPADAVDVKTGALTDAGQPGRTGSTVFRCL
jgi:hypothetical protein